MGIADKNNLLFLLRRFGRALGRRFRLFKRLFRFRLLGLFLFFRGCRGSLFFFYCLRIGFAPSKGFSYHGCHIILDRALRRLYFYSFILQKSNDFLALLFQFLCYFMHFYFGHSNRSFLKTCYCFPILPLLPDAF